MTGRVGILIIIVCNPGAAGPAVMSGRMRREIALVGETSDESGERQRERKRTVDSAPRGTRRVWERALDLIPRDTRLYGTAEPFQSSVSTARAGERRRETGRERERETDDGESLSMNTE